MSTQGHRVMALSQEWAEVNGKHIIFQGLKYLNFEISDLFLLQSKYICHLGK